MENIIAEIRQAKECLKTGNYELAYEMMQNADDELTRRELEFYQFMNGLTNEWETKKEIASHD